MQTSFYKLPGDTFQLSGENFLTAQPSDDSASVHQWTRLSHEGPPEPTVWPLWGEVARLAWTSPRPFTTLKFYLMRGPLVLQQKPSCVSKSFM